MTKESFKGKTPEEIANAVGVLEGEAQMKAQFSALQSVDAETRGLVVDILEKYFVDYITDYFQEAVEERGAAVAKETLMSVKTPLSGLAEELGEEQALAELARQLAAIKGDAAHPLVKAATAELAKLSKEQCNTENTILCAFVDALGKTPENEEKRHLIELDDAFDWHVTIAVQEHFNAVGKYQAFASAPTPAEKQAQTDAEKGILLMSTADASLASLKSTDIFMQVARRVGTDAELAALLPVDKLDAEDAGILEKNHLDSLAALVKTALQNKPK